MAERVPVRTCVGCRRSRPQPTLLRFHLDEKGHLCQHRNGAGRGAWLCSDTIGECFGAAVERKAFARALRQTPDLASIRLLGEEWPNNTQE